MAKELDGVTLVEYTANGAATMMNNIIKDALNNPQGKTAQALKQIGIDPRQANLRQQAMKKLGFDESNIGGIDKAGSHRLLIYSDGSQIALLSGESKDIMGQRGERLEHKDLHIQNGHGVITAQPDKLHRTADATNPEFLDLLFNPKTKPLGTNGIHIPNGGGGMGRFTGNAAGIMVDLNDAVKQQLETTVTILAKNDRNADKLDLMQVASAARAAINNYSDGTVLTKPAPTDTPGRKV